MPRSSFLISWSDVIPYLLLACLACVQSTGVFKELSFTSRLGDVTPEVPELFCGRWSPKKDHHGLMFKKSLDENAGMLFLYKDSAKRVLYMRNTLIPLDAGWFTHDGTLKEVMQISLVFLGRGGKGNVWGANRGSENVAAMRK